MSVTSQIFRVGLKQHLFLYNEMTKLQVKGSFIFIFSHAALLFIHQESVST